MKSNLMKLANPCIFDINPYQPGKPVSECQREYGLSQFVKLASNENPFGPSPKVIQAIQEALPHIALYPDSHGFELRKALSEKYDVAIDNLMIGNGSEEILRMLLQAFIVPGQEVIFGQYSFMGYEILAKSVGAHVTKVQMPRWKMDFNEILKAISPKTKMILLANPNNPTGTYVNDEELRSFLTRLPSNVLVVCDEAYYEYIHKADYPQTHGWIAEFPNLIVTRTFSKGYGLAGLRVGYAIAHEEIVALVNRIRQPFNVNTLAQVAALSALNDQVHLEYCIKNNEINRDKLCAGLTDMGISYIPSEANFLMIHVKTDGFALHEALLKMGIIIRPLRYYQLQHYVRVSIGLEEENNCFLNAVEKLGLREKVS
ncbi:MAG: histidinol-phosphate transaminase [Candidatus Berkiella sp.]